MTAPPPAKLAEMIVHERTPQNLETPRDVLAASALTPLAGFYVRSHGEVPDADRERWRLRVDGLVDQELSLSLAELADGRFAVFELTAALQCAGNRRFALAEVAEIPGEAPWGPGATGNATWRGVALADVLAAAAPGSAARHVAFVGADRSQEAEPPQAYAASIPLRKAQRPEVMLAWAMNGEPLWPQHGAPLRALVPGYIGARSVKWLERIELRDVPSDGFFQATAYRLLRPDQAPGPGVGLPLGEVALNADILAPAGGEAVAAGPVTLHGHAFAGGERRVARVDVSADGGRTWTEAELLEDLGRWALRRWRAELVLEAGEHELVVRAWDSAAATQPEDAAGLWNPKGYVNNAWGRVRVRAA